MPGECGLAEPDYYWYLNQSGTYTVDGTNDAKEFADTRVRVLVCSSCLFSLALQTFVRMICPFFGLFQVC